MYWTLTLIALLFTIPTYGISLLLHLILIMTYKDKTKNSEVKKHIKKSLSRGKIIDTDKIEWEDALQYAQEEGKEFTTIDNMISFYICQREERNYILMMPNSSGGVSISAYKRETSNTLLKLLEW